MKCFQTKIHFQELATCIEKVVILNALDAVLNSGLSSFETFGGQAKRQLFLPEIVRSNFENFLCLIVEIANASPKHICAVVLEVGI